MGKLLCELRTKLRNIEKSRKKRLGWQFCLTKILNCCHNTVKSHVNDKSRKIKKYIFESSNKCQNLNLNGFIHRLHQVYSEPKLFSQLCHEEIYFNKIWQKWQPLIGH